MAKGQDLECSNSVKSISTRHGWGAGYLTSLGFYLLVSEDDYCCVISRGLSQTNVLEMYLAKGGTRILAPCWLITNIHCIKKKAKYLKWNHKINNWVYVTLLCKVISLYIEKGKGNFWQSKKTSLIIIGYKINSHVVEMGQMAVPTQIICSKTQVNKSPNG